LAQFFDFEEKGVMWKLYSILEGILATKDHHLVIALEQRLLPY